MYKKFSSLDLKNPTSSIFVCRKKSKFEIMHIKIILGMLPNYLEMLTIYENSKREF